MKQDLKSKIRKMAGEGKFYGTATLGARGQIVIPAEARSDLKLKPGDQMLVIGKLGRALGLVKAEEFEGFIKIVMDSLAGTGMEKHIKEYLLKTFGKTI